MRLLHTSDWHLGRSFHREDMLGAQAAFVDHLVDTVASENVDAVVIAGDIYDRALPPVDAVQLCNEALRRLTGLDVRIVIISGNHDSAQRLGFGSDLMEAAGVHLRTDPASIGEPVMLEDRHGPLACYGIPYTEPGLVRQRWELGERSHTAALGHAMSRVRDDLATRPAGTRSVVAAHAFVTGGEASDSERDISVGGVGNVPASVFAGADYAALGHLHGRQAIADTVRYCGSPLAYSFSEEHQRKGSWLVDIGPAGVESVEFVQAPVPRPLARVSGTLDDLLTGQRWAPYEDHWLQVTLTDPVRPKAAMERLRERFPHALVLGFAPVGAGPGDERSWTERVRGRNDTELAFDFVREVRGEPADEEEAGLLHAAFESCRTQEASA